MLTNNQEDTSLSRYLSQLTLMIMKIKQKISQPRFNLYTVQTHDVSKLGFMYRKIY